MDRKFQIGISLILLVGLSTLIFVQFQIVPDGSCLNEDSATDSEHCIVGENAELTKTLSGTTEEPELYGKWLIERDSEVINESEWTTIDVEESEYSYEHTFQDEYYVIGDYEYSMFVSETESLDTSIDNFNYSFEVVESPSPNSPLSNLLDYFAVGLENMLESIENEFDERDILTPTVE